MIRKSSLFRMFGNLYILAITGLVLIIYYYFLYPETALLSEKEIIDYIFVAWSHLLLITAAIAFVNTVTIDPGKIPNYWGFFFDDSEEKRRRYCLICHVFKPERCHHCSTCNRCVLNMDHHCPWLNNCIGFFNRKFFLLLLGYTFLLQLSIFSYYMPTFLRFVRAIVENDLNEPDSSVYIVPVLYLASAIIMAIIGRFLRFHLTLVMKNRTTIENLEIVRNENQLVDYNIGCHNNFQQVFGRNPWLWFIPLNLRSGKPAGDGVVWPILPMNIQYYQVQTYQKSSDVRFTSNKISTNYPVAVALSHDSIKAGKESGNKNKPPKIDISISKLDVTSDTFLSRFHNINVNTTENSLADKFKAEEKKNMSHEESKSYNESFNVYHKEDMSSVMGN